MRVAAIARSLSLGTAGAGRLYSESVPAASKNQNLQQQQVAMEQRNQELQTRASTLDHDNQELETLLAQARQQNRLLDDQLAAVRQQLSSTTTQLAQLRDQKQMSDKQVESMMASTKRRTGATITANNSLDRALPALHLPGVDIRADGDVVRVELPAAQLFQPGGVAMQSTRRSPARFGCQRTGPQLSRSDHRRRRPHRRRGRRRRRLGHQSTTCRSAGRWRSINIWRLAVRSSHRPCSRSGTAATIRLFRTPRPTAARATTASSWSSIPTSTRRNSRSPDFAAHFAPRTRAAGRVSRGAAEVAARARTSLSENRRRLSQFCKSSTQNGTVRFSSRSDSS